MKHQLLIFLSIIFFSGLSFSSCTEQKEKQREASAEENTFITKENDTEAFLASMQTHLDAVSNRDLESLRSTLSPNGNMQLILPGSAIREGVEEFMEYHRAWFEIPDWTFETHILNSEVGPELGMAVVEIVYREPLRDGKPYFNKMIVSYVLQKIDGQWFVIKDHASSVEKSTDATS